MNVIKMTQEMIDSGELAELLRTVWTLTKSPIISNIKTEYDKSQLSKDNSAVIKSASPSRFPVINQHQVEMSAIFVGMKLPPMVPPVIVTEGYDPVREGNEIGNETAIEKDGEDFKMAKLDEHVASVGNDQDVDDIDNMKDIVAVVNTIITPGNQQLDDNSDIL